ncbi:unnamed protein product [Cuscuta europaea]|jgi:hypothetical protein
MRY